MDRNQFIVFVCEHGAAKSIIAATYFNHLARQVGSDLWAVARGTNPDSELSPRTVEGLARDGLTPSESVPQKLTDADVQSAQRIITFCDLPAEFQLQAMIEHWDLIPPVSENYENAREAIIERIHWMLRH